MCTNIRENLFSAGSQDVDDAVGVQNRHWYVAIVKHNTEKISKQKLDAMGYDTYVASQEEYHIWRNGKRKKIERIVIPSMIFIHCTEKERLKIVTLPFIFRFLTNKAGKTGPAGKPVAKIPPVQMGYLRFMLGNSDVPVEFTPTTYRKGDRVRVIRGRLAGIEGEVYTTTEGQSHLVVRLDILGCARITIDPINLEPLR